MPAEPVQFKITLGAEVTNCAGRADMLATFHLYISMDICLGGPIACVASKLGWSTCMNIGKIQFYVFLLKLVITLNIPIPIPPPIGVRGTLSSNLALGSDVTKAVRSFCERAYHDGPYRSKICRGNKWHTALLFGRAVTAHASPCTVANVKTACLQDFRTARGSNSVTLKVQILVGVNLGFVKIGKWKSFYEKTWR